MNLDKKFNKIIVCDGSYMIHRSLHVDSMFNLKNSKGLKTGGIFGFLRSFINELSNCKDYYPVVTWDSGLSDRRISIDSHYKKADERNKDYSTLTPEELDNDYVTQYRRQRNLLIKLLSYFGIPSLKYKGWEGDDLMFILTKLSNNSIVLTDDRDLLQLLSNTCNVRRPMANENWNISQFLESRSFNNIYDFVLYKAIIGDPSDNIPKSCKGIGESSINDFINLLYTFKDDSNWDFSMYPETEEDMKNWCNKFGIKYKKAYLNFDKIRFYINLQLVDLNLVEEDIDDRLIESIVMNINNCRQDVDYFKAIKMLSELEIREFSADRLMESVSNRTYNIGV